MGEIYPPQESDGSTPITSLFLIKTKTWDLYIWKYNVLRITQTFSLEQKLYPSGVDITVLFYRPQPPYLN